MRGTKKRSPRFLFSVERLRAEQLAFKGESRRFLERLHRVSSPDPDRSSIHHRRMDKCSKIRENFEEEIEFKNGIYVGIACVTIREK